MSIKPTIDMEAAPRYRQIHEILRNLIRDGTFLPGELMPTEKEICEKYHVSRFTTQSALKRLVDEGLVVRRQGVGTFVSALSADEGHEVRLTLGSIYKSETPLAQKQIEFARRVAELTRNQIRVDITHALCVENGSKQIAALSDGALDMFSAATDWLEQEDATWSIVNLPFLFKDIEHARRFSQSSVAEKLRSNLLKKRHIRVLSDNFVRPGRIIFSKRPCFDLDDFLGLTLRIPAIRTYRDVWLAVGASPIEIPWSEIKNGLESNVVDSIDVACDVAYPEGFHRLAPYATITRHIYSRACIVISEQRYQALRSDIQQALTTAAVEMGNKYSTSAMTDWTKDKERMISEDARFIHTNMEPFRRKTQSLYKVDPPLEKYLQEIIHQ